MVAEATPRIEFLDRGKTSIALPETVGAAVRDLVVKVTKDWAKQRRIGLPLEVAACGVHEGAALSLLERSVAA